MSYEPLHHKYRPQTFAHLVGQEAISQTLVNAIRTQRIAPAYLFTGPRGTGKTSSARILAKSLNCLKQDQPTESPCGVCDVCRTIASGTALDVIEIDAASNTGVDNIRDLIERAQFAPVQCRYKVYVVDECHMLSTAAFNALLKTLEEPPKHVVFVLATTDPQRVLPTIISRCQRFDFRRIPLQAMVQHLQDIAIKENIDITLDALTLVAQVAQGGLRDAESLLDQLGLLSGQVTIEEVWDLVGVVPERDLMALTQAIHSNNAEAVFDNCRRLLDRGREPIVVLQNLASFYRDLLIAKTAPNRNDLVAVTIPTWQQMCEFAGSVDISWILQGQQHLKNSETQIKNSTGPRLWLEVTLLGLLPSAISLQPRQQENHKSQIIPAKSTRQPPQTIDTSTIDVLKDTSQRQPDRATQASPAVHRQHPASNSVVSESPVTDNVSIATPEEVTEPMSTALNKPSEKQSELEQLWQQVIENIDLKGTRQLLCDYCCLLKFKDGVASIAINGKGKFKLIERTAPQINKAFAKTVQSPVKLSFKQVEVTQLSSASVLGVSQFDSNKSETDLSALAAKEPTSQNTTTELMLQSKEALTATKYPAIDTQHQMPFQAEALERTEVNSSSPTTAVIPSPLQDLDLSADEVEKALTLLKQSFEGEIIQLTEDFQMGEFVTTSRLQLEDEMEDTTVQLETDLEEDFEEQNRIQIAATHEWQVSELAALENTEIRERLEAMGYDEEDEIPF